MRRWHTHWSRWRRHHWSRWRRRHILHRCIGPLGLRLTRWSTRGNRQLNDFWFHFETELQEKLLCFFVPHDPELAFTFIHFSTGNLESNGLIWLCSKQQILPTTIRWLHLLLISRHESMTRSNAFTNFRVINLEKQTLLATLTIPLLSYPVTRTTNFNKFFDVNTWLGRCRLLGRFFSFFGSSSRKIGLMLFPLCVS